LAIKYVRKGYRESALGSDTWQDAPRGLSRMTPKQRLIMIYLGIGAFVVVVAFAQLIVPRLQFQGQPTLYGEGVVFGKTITTATAAKRQYRVGIALRSPDGRALRAYMAADAALWQELAEGDRVAVTYQMGRWGRKVRFHTVERFELDVPIQ